MMDARSESLARVIERIGVLTRDFAANGTHPFKERRLGRAPMNVLFALSRTDGLGVAVLAHRLSVTSGAISQTVDMLREAGLVVSEVNPEDGRGRLIRLTAEARR
ncbi:MAG: MarR family winged helix-turn-helix transcriptional regulator, partial [Rhodoglobus sp.]